MMNDKPISVSVTSSTVFTNPVPAPKAPMAPAVEKVDSSPAVRPPADASKSSTTALVTQVATTAKEKVTGNTRIEEVEETKLAERAKAKESDSEALRERLAEAIPKVREAIQKNQRSLDFKVAENENRVIITVIDKETDRIIRQIPPEEVLQLAENITQGAATLPEGSILDSSA